MKKSEDPKKIPTWLWWVIAKSLGIKIHPTDRVFFASCLHIATITSAMIMLLLNFWYCGYDIASDASETDILDGIIRVVMVLQFTGIGVYAHRLSYRLFSHPKFMELMHLHSKTVMKIHSALILFLLNVFFVIVHGISDHSFILPIQNNETNSTSSTEDLNPCQRISIPVSICHSYFISQSIFSFFFLIWNVLVSLVLVSVARTHTVSLRRFLSELEMDAHFHDLRFREKYYGEESSDGRDSLKKYFWKDTDAMQSVMRDTHDSVVSGELVNNSFSILEAPPESSGSSVPVLSLSPDRTEALDASRDIIDDSITVPNSFGDSKGDKCQLRALSEQEILHKYWKIATQVRLTSLAFQRWMIWIVTIVGLWSAIRIVYWLSHVPDLYEATLLFLPLVSLPLLASSYAEVNYEGVKVIQSIMPTPERIHMFRYLKLLPIEMTTYGHRISYGTLGTVLFGLFAAFVSKIVLQEINKVVIE